MHVTRPLLLRSAAHAAAAALLGTAAAAAHLDGALRQAMADAPKDGRIAVIVSLEEPGGRLAASAASLATAEGRRQGLAALQQRSQTSMRAIAPRLERGGASEIRVLWALNAVALRASPDLIAELAVVPEVVAVRLDATFRLPRPAAASASVPAWNLSALRAPALWALGFTGEGVVVALLDSGVDGAHSELAPRWRGRSADWFDPHGEHSTPFDRDGHGTQTLGLILGGDGSGDPIGVAPGARWIAAKIFDDDGNTSLSVIHDSFQWALDPDGDPATDDAPTVVSNSWGFDDLVDSCDTEFAPDIALLRAAGVAVVFSAGNSGPGLATSVSPANNPGALSVGGVDEVGAVLTFSGRGPAACGGLYPHVVAPAINVRTTDLTFGGLFPDSYAYVTGTSFAAPHVAGAIALLRAAYPLATVAQLEGALERGAADRDRPGADFESGFGEVDVLAAYGVLAGELGPPRCTDADGDGFFREPGCGTSLDCNDSDPNVHPGACEIAGDGVDQDCDGGDGGSCPSHRPRRALQRLSSTRSAPSRAEGGRP